MEPHKCAIAKCDALTVHHVCEHHWKSIDIAFRRLIYKRLSKYRHALNQAFLSVGAPPVIYNLPEGALDAGITAVSEDVKVGEERVAIQEIRNRPKEKRQPKIWRVVS